MRPSHPGGFIRTEIIEELEWHDETLAEYVEERRGKTLTVYQTGVLPIVKNQKEFDIFD